MAMLPINMIAAQPAINNEEKRFIVDLLINDNELLANPERRRVSAPAPTLAFHVIRRSDLKKVGKIFSDEK
jgi:hypothetical protein